MPQPSLSPALIDYCKNHSTEDLEQMMTATPDMNVMCFQDMNKKVEDMITQAEPEPIGLSYEDHSPMPGKTITMEHVNMLDDAQDLKEAAENMLISNAAREKLKRELARPESVRLREFTLKTLMEEQERNYFAKNGYAMSGKVKRQYRRLFAKKYDKGEIIKNDKMREDLIAEMNSPRNTKIATGVQYDQGATGLTVQKRKPVQPSALL